MACILCMPSRIFAQRITHTYNNVSLSEALLQLNNEQKEYVVNFLYTSWRTSASQPPSRIRNCPMPSSR